MLIAICGQKRKKIEKESRINDAIVSLFFLDVLFAFNVLRAAVTVTLHRQRLLKCVQFSSLIVSLFCKLTCSFRNRLD